MARENKKAISSPLGPPTCELSKVADDRFERSVRKTGTRQCGVEQVVREAHGTQPRARSPLRPVDSSSEELDSPIFSCEGDAYASPSELERTYVPFPAAVRKHVKYILQFAEENTFSRDFGKCRCRGASEACARGPLGQDGASASEDEEHRTPGSALSRSTRPRSPSPERARCEHVLLRNCR